MEEQGIEREKVNVVEFIAFFAGGNGFNAHNAQQSAAFFLDEREQRSEFLSVRNQISSYINIYTPRKISKKTSSQARAHSAPTEKSTKSTTAQALVGHRRCLTTSWAQWGLAARRWSSIVEPLSAPKLRTRGQ